MGSRSGHVVLRDARVSRCGPTPRLKDDVITQKLESAWPSVSARLAAMLRRRGVNPHDADEAVQETAARAMSTGVDFVDADDLLRWASVVSWRIAIDARRRSRVSQFDLPDRPDHVDVAQAAEHRIVLSAVTTRFKELSERDREALLTTFDDPVASTRRESVRVAVARHRARTRLRQLLEGLAAPVGAFIGRRRWHATPRQELVATTAPVLTCIALAVSTVIGGPSQEATRPVDVPQVTAVTIPSAVPAPAGAPTVPSAAKEKATTTHSAPPPPTTASGVTADVQVDDPAGKSTNVGTRPRRPDDHLACFTLPSTSGLVTTCVDPPTPGSP
jgi:DNA-directed RNA polymerase specialized sigma24 family protein